MKTTKGMKYRVEKLNITPEMQEWFDTEGREREKELWYILNAAKIFLKRREIDNIDIEHIFRTLHIEAGRIRRTRNE